MSRVFTPRVKDAIDLLGIGDVDSMRDLEARLQLITDRSTDINKILNFLILRLEDN